MLGPEDVALVQGLTGEVINAERGELLPTQLRAGSALVVFDCWAARTKDSPTGRRVITEFFLPGEIMKIDQFTSRAGATMALSKGQMQILPPAAFATLQSSRNVHEGIEWLFAVRQSINSEWLVNIGGRKAHQRLAHLLCELSVRVNNVGKLHGNVSEMPLTQTDLAAALAMSNVHLNVALQRLRSENVVDLRDKHLVILDRARLDAIAGFNDAYLLQWPTRIADRRNLLRNRQGGGERRRGEIKLL